MERRLLQILNGLVGLATVLLGGMQLVMGVNNPVYGSAGLPALPVLDSNLRFFGGLAMGLGLLLLWILPAIEGRTVLYRAVWACAFLGGLGRLISIPVIGMPPGPIIAITILEVVGAPLFVVWQARVARQARQGSS